MVSDTIRASHDARRATDTLMVGACRAQVHTGDGHEEARPTTPRNQTHDDAINPYNPTSSHDPWLWCLQREIMPISTSSCCPSLGALQAALCRAA
eukprot:3772948-Rhodomonas_salina.1